MLPQAWLGLRNCAKSLSIAIVCLASANPVVATEPTADVVQFNRDVRPILSDHCFQCHGPDQKNRKADLRFDQDDTLTTGPADGRLIQPKNPEESDFFQRLVTDDSEQKMPPPSHGRPLTADQIGTIKKWIEQGAEWQKHWSLIPPQRPAVPAVQNSSWPRNSIDHFVLSSLESAGVAPSPEADRGTLLRRVSLDLTGLPPTIEEIQAFEQDATEGAYERAVDRLLDSTRYGERMAIRWLDAARYADTHGYQTDGPRDMYRWRDWVIDAYNSNMPFDQFTIEQLAGDLLPNPKRSQLIATGFNRNHRANSEGGILDEEYLAEYAADRVETTCTVWLGVTMMCGRCHDHKYDPFSQKDYYQLFAFFNSVPERGKVFKIGNTPPLVRAPTQEQEQKLAGLDQQIQSHQDLLQQKRGEWQAALREWTKANSSLKEEIDWSPTDGLNFVASFDKPVENLVPPPKHAKPLFEDPLKDVMSDVRETTAQPTPGVVGKGVFIDGNGAINLGDVGNFDFLSRFSYSFWVKFPEDAQGVILARMKDDDALSGLSFVLSPEKKLQLNFVSRWLDDALRIETVDPLIPDQWQHIVVTYDATRMASGVQCILNGKKQPMKTLLDELLQTFKTNEPVRLGLAHSSFPPFKGEIDEVRAYDKVLSPAEIQVLGVPQTISAIAGLAENDRTSDQTHKLEQWYLENQSAEEIRKSWLTLRDLHKQRGLLLATVPTVMTMQENPEPTETHILVRGQYDNPGAQVSRGVPAQLSAMRTESTPNRLDLAKWLVDPQNPLTARVAVNRFWQMYFGQGIVKTVDDFGSQGEWPTHPDLLDWLATEFVESGWNVKQLQRLIVTSATYRQVSLASPEMFQKDPENRLLARGPRMRLSAEMIRDRALLVSGLLVDQVGGPSVLPYQPEGLWKELNGIFDYQRDSGDKLYRRSLYTYWKRTAPPPYMMTFDTAGRETCFVRETRTNTPIQALNLLNDVTFVEAARHLAERVLKDQADDRERVSLAFSRALSRPPVAPEVQMLLENVAAQRTYFAANPQAAEELLKVGDSPFDKDLSAAELASYTMLANLLFNLDEFVSKQ